MKFLLLAEQSLLVVFWVLLIFGFDSTYIAVLTVLSALVHELGHIIAVMLIHKKGCFMPKPDISGFRIKLPSMSYKEELICAISGPLANLILLVFTLPVSSPYAKTFAMLNLLTMLSNLLPIDGYDGFKILTSIFGLRLKCYARAQRILYSISFAFSCVMCFLALYILLKIGEGYWLFAVFFSVMLRAMIVRKNRDVF